MQLFFCTSGCSKPNYKGDGICDDENNNEGCDFDGGDCCIPNVNKDFCTECKCLEEGMEYNVANFCFNKGLGMI